MDEDERSEPRSAEPSLHSIKVVGPCKAGKSTLVRGLQRLGYNARVCAQEHSEVPTMWQRVAPARWLIYLDVSLESVRRRSPRSDWTPEVLEAQRRRLAHARRHSHLIVGTDELTEAEVLERVHQFLQAQGVRRIRPAEGE
ncbi:MAG: hypothetical protein NZ528_05645 [Caldilineales bacterium]|nr:hypothetical protein [Caldilineales bacterium]MDW8318477.1 hypothetical protein [Anaerolineae bacterium]